MKSENLGLNRNQKKILAFGAHPDDVEWCMGATLLKLKEKNYKIFICDLTKGEKGKFGTAKERINEAMKAAKYFGAKRIILDFGDQKVKDSPKNRKIIKDIIKKIKPDLIFCPYFKDKHPDHAACGKLLKEYNPIFYLPRDSYGKANLVVDVKGYFRKRQKIINCFKSQNPLRWKAEIKKHLKKFGKKIGSNYGEGFICQRKKKLENIFLPVK